MASRCEMPNEINAFAGSVPCVCAADYPWCWMANSDAPFAGSVPEVRLLRRVVQIGEGKIFGSLEFVTEQAYALGDRFRSRGVVARVVEELGYATHGWRLAKRLEREVA